tara:strand:+ start:156 stop:395 length:240 start_codon:yes stop_codon:yes gene_type:complete
MSKRKPKSDYKKIESLLNSNASEALKKSVAKDMDAPDRPLNIADMSDAGVKWEVNEKTEEELRAEEALYIDSIDRRMDK